MKTIAQKAYQDHLESQKLNWSTMTVDQRDASLREEKTLQLYAEAEQAENDAADLALAQQAEIEQRNSLISEMQEKGYSGNGTLEDFKKLFLPSIFGNNHEAKALEAFTSGQDFIELYRQYGNL